MVMNKEMMDAIEKNNIVWLATANNKSTPNLVPIGFARPLDGETILLVANFMNKSLENLKNNPRPQWLWGTYQNAPTSLKARWKYTSLVNTLMMQWNGLKVS